MTTYSRLDAPGIETRPILAMALLQGSAVFLFALAVRLYGLGEAPIHFDEYYHLYAAQGWNEEGRLAILGGEYHRAALYTRLVAAFQAVMGETLFAARFSSALFGAALAAGVFVWVRLEADVLAAWLAGFIVAISPELIAISQTVRFYAPHGLVVFIAAACLFALSVRWAVLGTGARVGLAAIILISLVVGAYLQPTTVIAAIAMGTGAALCVATGLGWQLPQGRGARLLLLLAVVGGIAAVLALHLLGILALLWTEFRSAALWNEENRNAISYYHWHMKDAFGPIWLLFPAALACAALRAPRLTLYCAGLFAVAVVLHSLAGMKNLRYLAWAFPFFFIIWALALPVMLGWLYRQALTAADRALALPADRLGGWPQRVVAVGLVALVIVAATIDFSKPWRSMGDVGRAFVATDERVGNARAHAAWQQVRAQIADRLAAGAIVATPNEFLALHHLGRADVVVSRSRLHEAATHAEFTRDARTGIPAISTTESLQALMACTDSGLLVIEDRHFPAPYTVTPEMAAVLTERTTKLSGIEAPVHIFAWDAPIPAEGADCSTVETGSGTPWTVPPAVADLGRSDKAKGQLQNVAQSP